MSAPQRIGNYRVLGQIGTGATGVVYLAVQESIARQVAIKVLHASLAGDSKQARRFLTEARAVNIVRHPGLVQISEVGQTESGRPYLVMELLQGQTLRAELTRRGKLPLPEALALMADIADAMAAAHHHRVIHRDLKPENVMLVPDPAVPRGVRIKLLDFGVAKLGAATSGSSLIGDPTAAGAILGTPTYMSPEQVQGEAATDRADVYALGVLCYEVLSGQPPFTGPPFAVMTQHVQQEPPPLRKAAPEVPERIAALVMRMLTKKAAQRPTMRSVSQALQLALGGNEAAAAGSFFAGTAARVLAFGLTLAMLVGAGLWWRKRAARGSDGGCPAATFCAEGREALSGRRLRALAVTMGADGPRLWASGDQGTLLRGTGGRWTAVPVGEGAGAVKEKLAGLWLNGAEEPWLVGGGGLVLRRSVSNGQGRFQQQLVPGAPTLTGLWRGETLWVTSKDGVVFYEAEGRFSPISLSEKKKVYYGVVGRREGREDTVFLAGREGALLRCKTTGCEFLESGTEETLHAAALAPDGTLWLAGKSGVLVRHDGKAGRAVPTGTERDLNALWIAPEGVVYAAGDHGTLLRVAAGASGATALALESSEDFDALCGLAARPGEHELWAAGTGGVIWHYRP